MINRYFKIVILFSFVLIAFACGGKKQTVVPVIESAAVDTIDKKPGSVIEELDTEQDITQLTLQELYILRSSVYARHGMLFEESELRSYWRDHTVWYDTLSRSRTLENGNQIYQPDLPEAEQSFVERIDKQMAFLQSSNYIANGKDTVSNILNIINLYQYAGIIDQSFLDELALNNYVLVPDSVQQLFQIYQYNDSLQLPGFVTTDVFLQLTHIYYAYMLRKAEEEFLAPMLADLCFSLYQSSMAQAKKEKAEEMQNLAYYNAAFYAVPYTLITGKHLKINGIYQMQMEEELAYIDQQEAHLPSLLEVKTMFPYEAFQPYGHYTRTSMLRRYYKALRWLQLAPYCTDQKTQLKQATFTAVLLNTEKDEAKRPLITGYRNFFELVSFLKGQPAYYSLLDLATYLQKERIQTMAAAMTTQAQSKILNLLKKEIPLYPASSGFIPVCKDGIYFIPQSYYPDDEVLKNMADPAPGAQRAFPSVLDVFAAFGSSSAFDWLFFEKQEDTLWIAYPDQLKKMKDKMKKVKSVSLYHQWIGCLLALQQTSPGQATLTKNKAWAVKNLQTASASWVKLKHDVLLYGIIPEYPDTSHNTVSPVDTLPKSFLKGYVEPNVVFWTKLHEWVSLLDKTFSKHQIMTEDMQVKTQRLLYYLSIVKNASAKAGLLNEEESSFIAHMGDSIEYFTLSMVEPLVDRWAYTAGPDRDVAVSEKIYVRNVSGSSTNGDLYAASGNVHQLYVVVQIGGYLYLTRGAAFTYHEFPLPPNQEFTNEDWSDLLRKYLKKIDTAPYES